MAAEQGFILGFDPGGKGNFGWSVCCIDGDKPKLCKVGLADNAHEAITKVECVIDQQSKVVAVGIDAPMFWARQGCHSGRRKVDDLIKNALEKEKDSGKEWINPSVVVAPNSLVGAVLMQGLLIALQLREKNQNVKITEAHPSALRQLAKAKGQHKPLNHLTDQITDRDPGCHMRDATIAAYAAWAMHKEMDGWSDLYKREPCPVQPCCTPVSYWMPIKCSRGKC